MDIVRIKTSKADIIRTKKSKSDIVRPFRSNHELSTSDRVVCREVLRLHKKMRYFHYEKMLAKQFSYMGEENANHIVYKWMVYL